MVDTVRILDTFLDFVRITLPNYGLWQAIDRHALTSELKQDSSSSPSMSLWTRLTLANLSDGLGLTPLNGDFLPPAAAGFCGLHRLVPCSCT